MKNKNIILGLMVGLVIILIGSSICIARVGKLVGAKYHLNGGGGTTSRNVHSTYNPKPSSSKKSSSKPSNPTPSSPKPAPKYSTVYSSREVKSFTAEILSPKSFYKVGDEIVLNKDRDVWETTSSLVQIQ